jgi:molybdopterin/thiamine biosynthesis adenylyltransferase
VNDRRAFFRELASVAREARRATQSPAEETAAVAGEAPPVPAAPTEEPPRAAAGPAPTPTHAPTPAPALTDAELERYSRQLVLPEWSEAAQLALRDASVLVIGAGGLGSPVAAYLAAAGVGRLGIADDDAVELSNLARQPLHFTPDVGVPKAESAAAKLRFLNPGIVVEPYRVRVDRHSAPGLVAGQDLVVDCSDSFETRYAVNAACCAAGVPLVEGGVLGTSGLVMAIRPGESACYRCAFPEAPAPGSTPSCAEAGVLGPAAGVVGSLQALEALKLLAGVGTPLLDAFLQLDLADADVLRVAVRRRPECPDCGTGERALGAL